jgi:probable HAF family extracellular repeat protein
LSYTIIDLGTLGSGTYSVATGINNAGQVVGYFGVSPANSLYHAFRYDGHVVRDIGTLAPNGNEALGISNSGQVIGDYFYSTQNIPHAFATAANSDLNPSTDDLGTLGGNWSRAFSINSLGQIAGESYPAGNVGSRAFVYSGGVMSDLGSLGGSNNPQSLARGINDLGSVVGWTFVSNGNIHAFLYQGSRMIDLGTLGGSASEGQAINARGWVVGSHPPPAMSLTPFFTTAPRRTIWARSAATRVTPLGSILRAR